MPRRLRVSHRAIKSFAENIFHVGKAGSAHKLKLINNFLSLGAASLTQ